MSLEPLETIVRSIVNQLVDGEYDAVVSGCITSRLTSEDINDVLTDYGRTFIKPPADAFRDIDAIAEKNSKPARWSVHAPLWTSEEGRSDLTLELTVIRKNNRWEVELDDLHVL